MMPCLIANALETPCGRILKQGLGYDIGDWITCRPNRPVDVHLQMNSEGVGPQNDYSPNNTLNCVLELDAAGPRSRVSVLAKGEVEEESMAVVASA